MLDPRITRALEDEILNLIDQRDEYTRSDLEGVVTVLVNKIMELGHEVFKEQEASS